MQLIDTHAHLDQDSFDADREAVIARAAAAGVVAMIAIGCTGPTSAAAVDLAAGNPSIYASVGIQPNYAAEVPPSDWDQVVALSTAPRVVALGETGLDKYWDHSPLSVQQDYFDRHLRLSQSSGLP